MANKSQQSSSPIHSRSLLQSDKLTWDFDVLGLVCFYFVLCLLDHLLERDQGIFMTRVVVLQRSDVNSWREKDKKGTVSSRLHHWRQIFDLEPCWNIINHR